MEFFQMAEAQKIEDLQAEKDIQIEREANRFFDLAVSGELSNEEQSNGFDELLNAQVGKRILGVRHKEFDIDRFVLDALFLNRVCFEEKRESILRFMAEIVANKKINEEGR